MEKNSSFPKKKSIMWIKILIIDTFAFNKKVLNISF